MAQHLITGAPPDVTGADYFEHLAGAMLPADIYARYLRQTGHDVLFVSATDEHGLQAGRAAAEAGLPVDEYCAQQHRLLEKLSERFLLSWDHFGRSSSAENHELTQHFADSLERNGFLVERESEPVSSGRRRAATGVPNALHLFLRQGDFTELLPDDIGRAADDQWTDRNQQDRCITRDLAWGVPVGWPGYEGKVFDSYFDSSIACIGATYEWSNRRWGRGSDAWRSWWFDADAVTYTQFIPNHLRASSKIAFESIIIGSWEPWKLPDYVKGFDRLTPEDGPFSAVDSSVLASPPLQLPADCWRWFVMANAPETGDEIFSWQRFAAVVNDDLVNGFASFISRVFALDREIYGSRTPVGGKPSKAERELSQSLKSLICEYMGSLFGLQFRRAAAELRAIWALASDYLDNSPLSTSPDTDPLAAETAMRTALNLAHVMAVVSEPVIPEMAAAVLAAFDLPPGRQWRLPELATLDHIRGGSGVRVPEVSLDAVSADQLSSGRPVQTSAVARPVSSAG